MTNSPRRRPADIRAELLREALDLLRNPASTTGPPRVVRIERAVAAVDLLERLEAQPADTKWYWAARDNAWAVAAAGVAWQFHARGASALDIVSEPVRALLAGLPVGNLVWQSAFWIAAILAVFFPLGVHLYRRAVST